MKYKNAHQGWYKLKNADKFIRPLDESMGSSKPGYALYKSSLERQLLVYCDLNPHVVKYSLEPFAVPYVKPTDGRVHRYYIDFLLVLSTGDKVLAEVKTSVETVPPVKTKNINKYKNEMQTYAVNVAKWQAAKKFAENKGFKFLILTEKQLF